MSVCLPAANNNNKNRHKENRINNNDPDYDHGEDVYNKYIIKTSDNGSNVRYNDNTINYIEIKVQKQ